VFTGIIEAIGRYRRLERVGNRVEIEVEVGAEIAGGSAIGDSIALDGCDLTVVSKTATALRFQAVQETWDRTTLRDRKPGDAVNVERALRADSRLSGHFVQGHVDGTGAVRAVQRDGDDVRMQVACAPEIVRALVPKGSVTVDGVALTVVEAAADHFSVALIPHTLEQTTLRDRSVGDRVNIEIDVLGKYVLRYLERAFPAARSPS
jgi:riboflavin synthase alpha subunit